MKTPKTQTEMRALPAVRVFSSYGPCLAGRYLVRVNKNTTTVASANGHESDVWVDREPSYRVHAEPCHRCRDHENTVYPNGYMN